MSEIKVLEFGEELFTELSHGACKKTRLNKPTLTPLSF